jgi:uncharacterized membrane protein YebE (DUF533 family)
MFKRLTTLFLFSVLALTGCATSEKSILFGSTIGIGIGAGLGSSQNGDQGGMVGALIGGIAGGLLGYQGYKDKRKKEQAAIGDLSDNHFDMTGNARSSNNGPRLKPAQVRVKLVEDQIKDGTFVPSHFEYEISEPARWENSK